MGENVYQFNLFNFDKETYKIKKPIRLIELFSGIGAQAKALEILGVPFEHWKTCEWAVNSIKSYNAIHIKDFTDYSKDLTKEQLIEYLDGNISTNYNEPCNVKRQNEKWLRDVYNNCIATHNLMNIMKVKGSDLEIKDRDKYEYIMTYSFPCQDLSLAGLRQGMATSQADGGTRSGLLWEVERILDELNRERERDYSTLPQILLMENVPEVIGAGNVDHFIKWTNKLESLGYSNYFEILNAKDYGIPQNRRRCFMISILGDYAYDFPLKLKLKYRLKDFLEKQVDEKYYLSDKMINYITATNEKWTGNNSGAIVNKDIGCTINTAPGQRRCDASNYVGDDLPSNTDLQKIGNYGNGHHAKDVFDTNGCSPTITTGNHGLGQAIVDKKNDNDTFIAKKYSDYQKEHNGELPNMFNPYNMQEIIDLAPAQTTQCGSTTSSATVLVKQDAKTSGGGVAYNRKHKTRL